MNGISKIIFSVIATFILNSTVYGALSSICPLAVGGITINTGYQGGTVFKEVTNQMGLGGIDAESFNAFDTVGDGYSDLLINLKGNLRMGGKSRLFINLARYGRLGFQDVTEAYGLSEMQGRGIVADLNNDGLPDIITTTGQVWIQEKPGKFYERSAQLGLNLPKDVSSYGLAEFNRNGYLTIIVGLTEDYNKGNYKFFPPRIYDFDVRTKKYYESTAQRSPDLQNVRVWGRGVTVGDINQDGYPEAFISTYRLKPNILLQAYPNGQLQDVAGKKNVAGTQNPPQYKSFNSNNIESPKFGHTISASMLDLDNRGVFDIVTANLAHKLADKDDCRGHYCGDSQILRNSGYPHYNFTDVRPQSGIPYLPVADRKGYRGEETWSGVVGADFLNNGRLHLFVPQTYDGAFGRVYENLGGYKFREITSQAGVRVFDSTGAIWIDPTNGGSPWLITNGKTSPGGKNGVHVWQNIAPTSSRDFLQLQLRPTVSNRSAIGTSVYMKFRDGGVMVRQVEGPTGGQSQQNNSLLHFSFPKGRQIAQIEIRWPSGRIQFENQIPQQLNKIYSVVEK